MTYSTFFEQADPSNDGLSKVLEIISAHPRFFQFSTIALSAATSLLAKNRFFDKIRDYFKNSEYFNLIVSTYLYTSWFTALTCAIIIAAEQNVFSNPNLITLGLIGFTALSGIANIYMEIQSYFSKDVPDIKLKPLRLNYSITADILKMTYQMDDQHVNLRSVLQVVETNKACDKKNALALTNSGISSLSTVSETAFQNVLVNGRVISLEIPLHTSNSDVSEVIEHFQRNDNGRWVEAGHRNLFTAQQEHQILRG